MKNRLVVLFCLAIFLASAGGCKKAGPATNNDNPRVSPSSAAIDFGGSVDLAVSGCNSAPAWSVSDGAMVGSIYTPALKSGAHSATVSCGGKTATAQITVATVTVVLSPDKTTVGVGEKKQLELKVNGAVDKRTVCAVSGGSTTDTALYTAPTDTTGSFGLTCQSVADQTRKAISVITVKPTIRVVGRSTVMVGQTQHYTTEVLPANVDQDVNLTVSLGSISQGGEWQVPGAPGVAVITAFLDADPTVTASITVEILDQDMFSWFKKYSPAGGTAKGKDLVVTNDGKIIVGVDVIPDGQEETFASVVIYDTNGNLKKELKKHPAKSSVRAIAYNQETDQIFVTGTEDSGESQKALFLTTTTDLSVAANKSFQVGGKKTEGRDITIRNGEILLAVYSDSEYCSTGSNSYCSLDYLITANLDGVRTNQRAASKWPVSSNCRGKIDSIYPRPSDWGTDINFSGTVICGGVPSDTFIGNILADPAISYYYLYTWDGYGKDGDFNSKILWDENIVVPHNTLSDVAKLIFSTTSYMPAGGQAISVGLYMETDPPQNSVPVIASYKTVFWDGGNPSGINSLGDAVLTPLTNKILIGGSLQKIGYSDPTVTDGGIALFDLTPGSERVVWGFRFDNPPNGWVVGSIVALGVDGDEKIVLLTEDGSVAKSFYNLEEGIGGN